MATNPNLDALILREDFDVTAEGGSEHSVRDTLDISSLEKGHFFYESLRKPDFQRETANWSPEKVYDFIKTFLEGDLVPAIILWKSNGNIFVIDGAHRLSALIAWVNDDYGDGLLSSKFFSNRVAPEQKRAAEKARELVRRGLGSYVEHKAAANNPDPTKPEIGMRAKRLGSVSMKLQWVFGDAKKAEDSFFKINQSATVIDTTELSIIKARKKPNALAARALIRAGTGHKYWSGFTQSIQKEIERTAREVYDILHDPALQSPIKTLDLPVAGSGYSADTVKLIFDFINYANNLRPDMWQEPIAKRKAKGELASSRLPEDQEGTVTLEYLKKVRKIVNRISGSSPGSLGLHPAIYCFGATGRFQPTAFLGMVALVVELEDTNGFHNFSLLRDRFEEFLLEYRYFVNQIVGQYGSGTRGLEPLVQMYRIILESLAKNDGEERTISKIQSDPRLGCVKVISESDRVAGKNFSADTKSAAFLRDAIEGTVRCRECNARLHTKSVSIDHKLRIQDGGDGGVSNAQLMHPFCNTGVKEKKSSISRAKAQ